MVSAVSASLDSDATMELAELENAKKHMQNGHFKQALPLLERADEILAFMDDSTPTKRELLKLYLQALYELDASPTKLEKHLMRMSKRAPSIQERHQYLLQLVDVMLDSHNAQRDERLLQQCLSTLLDGTLDHSSFARLLDAKLRYRQGHYHDALQLLHSITDVALRDMDIFTRGMCTYTYSK
jgi:predicted negative regulator of RcsB-dependent stress response